jgi:hypothetical protein
MGGWRIDAGAEEFTDDGSTDGSCAGENNNLHCDSVGSRRRRETSRSAGGRRDERALHLRRDAALICNAGGIATLCF